MDIPITSSLTTRSGVLAATQATTLPLDLAVALMVVHDDPVAMASVVDWLGGVEETNNALDNLGYAYTRLRHLPGGGQRDRRASQWQPDPHLPSHTCFATTTATELARTGHTLVTHSPVVTAMLKARPRRAQDRLAWQTSGHTGSYINISFPGHREEPGPGPVVVVADPLPGRQGEDRSGLYRKFDTATASAVASLEEDTTTQEDRI